jgi:hypothetical protein
VFVFLVLFAINYFGTARRRAQAVEEE